MTITLYNYLPFQWFPFVHPPDPDPQSWGLFPPGGALAPDLPDGKIAQEQINAIKRLSMQKNRWYGYLM